MMIRRIGWFFLSVICLNLVCIQFNTPPAFAQSGGIQPLIKNGDFEQGLMNWDWRFDAVQWPEGTFTASGLARTTLDGGSVSVPGSSDAAPPEDDYLEMISSAQATSTDPTALSGGTAHLVVTQPFVATGMGVVKGQSGLSFGVTQSSDSQARLDVAVDLVNYSTGKTVAHALHSLEFHSPCANATTPSASDHPGSDVVGFVPWVDFQFPMNAQKGDEMVLELRVTLNVQNRAQGESASIAVIATFDDVQILPLASNPPPSVGVTRPPVVAFTRPRPDPTGVNGDVSGISSEADMLRQLMSGNVGPGPGGGGGASDGDFRRIKVPSVGAPVGDCPAQIIDMHGANFGDVSQS